MNAENPRAAEPSDGKNQFNCWSQHDTPTLRDLFAAFAIHGWSTHYAAENRLTRLAAAREAYEVADALLEARAKRAAP